jgi:glucose-1-phosphate cytidylyltransferase
MKLRTAVILCGGKGTRLGVIGKKIPKTLVKINGRPILWYIINSLLLNSFNHFILPIGYKGNLIKKYLKNNFVGKKYKVNVVGTGINSSISSRIYQIKNKISSDNFLLLNGDAIFNLDLNKIYINHKKKNKDITFLTCQAPLSYGSIGIKNKKIVSFERELNFDTVSSTIKKNCHSRIYSGISILSKKVLNYNFKKFVNFEKDLYQILIKKKNTTYVSISEFWHSIDSVKDIESLKKINDITKYTDLKLIKKKYEKKFLEK